MSDLQQQLADLRARVARINAKYDSALPARFSARNTAAHIDSPAWQEQPVEFEIAEEHTAERAQAAVEGWLGGETIETEHGRHFETEKLYERHRRHGSADIGALADLPEDLLGAISGGAAPLASPARWAFLDTETTGLAGGSGTCAFLVGIGRITPEGFRVRQFFMRDYCEEASLLDAVSRHLAPFRVLITYNGRSFDQPLLETRYRLNRSRPPFASLEHLDLLHGARRLWKLRFESCRLVDLENQILGFERAGDVPGALIPYLYFEYLRTGRAGRLLPVFHHNATDILTLACLTGIVPLAFKDPENLPFRHGAEIAGIARWLREAGDLKQARTLFRRAIDAGMPDDLMFRTQWDVAALERKLGAEEQAVAMWTDLAAVRNAFRIPALEELAKHYEHRQKDLALALETTRTALGYIDVDHEDSPALRRREQRLIKRTETRPKARSTVKRRRLL